MRMQTALIVGILLGACWTIQAAAQEEGTCEHPLSFLQPTTVTLDTRLYTDLQHPAGGCAGHQATGPDVVIDFENLPADGTVTWEADFPAILYVDWDTCDFSSCWFSSTGGTLDFWCGYEPVSPYNASASWHHVYIVVDGIDGAAGLITLHLEFSLNVPASSDTWGRVKNIYR